MTNPNDPHGMWPMPENQRDPNWLAAKAAGEAFFSSHFTPMQIPFKRLHPAAKPPSRVNHEDAGSDLYALNDPDVSRPLYPGERRLFDTGIAMEIPPGHYGHICDRSGQALKRGLHVLGGVVDSPFRGSVGIILLNTSQDPVWVEAGERIAQIIIKRHESPEFVETESLDETARAAGGFGSTGTT